MVEEMFGGSLRLLLGADAPVPGEREGVEMGEFSVCFVLKKQLEVTFVIKPISLTINKTFPLIAVFEFVFVCLFCFKL